MNDRTKHQRTVTISLAAAGIVAVGGMMQPSAADADAASAGQSDVVPNSYIAVLDRDAQEGPMPEQANTLAQKYNADVSHVYKTALSGFSFEADEAQAQELEQDADVEYVVPNQRFHTNDTQNAPPSWGLDRIDQRDLPLDQAYEYPTEADNVTTYVIDTGVTADHSTFDGRVSGGYDFIDNNNDPDDENGHGTHVAGTIGGDEYGVAKGVDIVPVRVLDADGSGTTEQIVAGIDWVAEQASGPSVANMSLGGPIDQALDDAVQGAIDDGVPFAIAAGNDSTDASFNSPARVDAAITVAASDESDMEADFSNYGSVVDLYAPGVDITSAWNDGGEDTIDGTSMASPHVAGAAALHLADNPTDSPAQVSQALESEATSGAIQHPSWMTPNRLLHVDS